jgi:hypothetical protein
VTEPLDLTRPDRPRRRRWIWFVGIGTPLVIVIAIGLALFQPWKLFTDKTVDDAAPLGATPIVTAEEQARPIAEPVAPMTATTEPLAETTAPAEPVVETMVSTADTTIPAPTTVPPTTAPPAPLATMFVSLDHGTSGSLTLLQDPDGRRYARIQDLDTDQGPDVDGPEEAFDDDYVNLGGLQGNLGNQNYEIPADVDLSRYSSLVIWCDRFDSAFGAAPLPA